MMLNNESYTGVFRKCRGGNSRESRGEQAARFIFLHKMCMNHTKCKVSTENIFDNNIKTKIIAENAANTKKKAAEPASQFALADSAAGVQRGERTEKRVSRRTRCGCPVLRGRRVPRGSRAALPARRAGLPCAHRRAGTRRRPRREFCRRARPYPLRRGTFHR